MSFEAFQNPQRQSVKGVVLIFFTTLYKIFRGFWAIAAYLVFSSPQGATLVYILLGIGVLGVAVLIYSYIYYQRFIFHIDDEKAAFILSKGVFSTEEIEIPFDKIQQINIQQSLLQRLIGVHSLVIDTAGGDGKEVNIKAISKAKAESLSSVLLKEKQELSDSHSTESTNATMEDKEEVEWEYKMNLSTLLKIGLSTNYLRGLILMMAFFSTIYQELNRWFKDYSGAFDNYMNEIPDPSNTVSGLFIVLIVVLLGSMLITIIEVFIKYFNLKLQRTTSSLQLEMGLKNNKRIALQPRRVQLLQITTNPIQKKLDLHKMKISLASMGDLLEKSKIKIPGMGKDLVAKVNDYLYQKEENNTRETFRSHIILFYRNIVFSLIPVVIGLILWGFMEYTNYWLWTTLVIGYLLFMTVYHWLGFRSKKLGFTENFIYKKHGVWNRVEARIETYKLQSVTVSQPYFYKKRALINLVFHTAGGDVSVKAIDKKVLPLINYALYKMESSKKEWM